MRPHGLGLSSGSVRITSGTNRRLRLFAVTQIAASFVLLAGAGALLTTLIALQQTKTGVEPAQRPRGPRAGQLRAAARADAAALSRSDPQDRRAARRRDRSRSARSCRGAKPAHSSMRSSPPKATRRPTVKTIRAPASARCRRASSSRSACRSSRAAISTPTTAPTARRS